jgi:mono/diheme cytochrome c family protein
MRKNMGLLSVIILSLTVSSLYGASGKKVFETYCWGCHHQTAVAFGPSFEEIASKRTSEEIKAMIVSPDDVSKVFGYKRNAMPPFILSEENLTAITNYILSYKNDENGSNEHNKSNVNIDVNKTIIEKPYPTVASIEEKK